MGAARSEIMQHLMGQSLLATRPVMEKLLTLDNPLEVIEANKTLGFKGMLTLESLEQMIARTKPPVSVAQPVTPAPVTQPKPKPVNETPPSDLGRVVAPIAEPQPVKIQFRNNMPDWKESDFSHAASDAPLEIDVHFDITGNSVTEGKMTDITSCFSSRLDQLRKMNINNSISLVMICLKILMELSLIW